jgi:hypothetical protein
MISAVVPIMPYQWALYSVAQEYRRVSVFIQETRFAKRSSFEIKTVFFSLLLSSALPHFADAAHTVIFINKIIKWKSHKITVAETGPHAGQLASELKYNTHVQHTRTADGKQRRARLVTKIRRVIMKWNASTESTLIQLRRRHET